MFYSCWSPSQSQCPKMAVGAFLNHVAPSTVPLARSSVDRLKSRGEARSRKVYENRIMCCLSPTKLLWTKNAFFDSLSHVLFTQKDHCFSLTKVKSCLWFCNSWKSMKEWMLVFHEAHSIFPQPQGFIASKALLNMFFHVSNWCWRWQHTPSVQSIVLFLYLGLHK